MTDKEMIAYLEDRIIQLEKLLAKYEPTEEEVNDMAKTLDHYVDATRYTAPGPGQYVRSGATLTFEVLQNAVDAVARRGR